MSILDLIPIPDGINQGIRSAKQRTMLSLLGNPRGTYTQACQGLEHPVLFSLIETRKVGRFRVSGLKPAVDALETILEEVRTQHLPIFEALGTAGMLCARFVRDSATTISNHSWGTAVDLTLQGRLDRRGDRLVQRGLATIAPIFNRHGWFWGAGFGTEDAMHFEAGDELLRSWHAAGLLNADQPLEAAGLSLGDRGPEVFELQTLLNRAGHALNVDGSFGPKTLDAVRAFQRSAGLNVDGVVTNDVLGALRAERPVADGAAGGQLPPDTLSVGDMGPPVRALQEKLNAIGYGLAVDGIFGRSTLAAVMAFQAAQGLSVEGVVGSVTRERLAALVG